MAWYTLKVAVGHEANIRLEIEALLDGEGLECRVALPAMASTDRPFRFVVGLRKTTTAISQKQLYGKSRPGWLSRQNVEIERLRSYRMVKIAPGYLFVRLRGADVVAAIKLFEGIRGIGAVDSCGGVPRAIAEPLAAALERGRFICDHVRFPFDRIRT